jgi:hypothetical protein
MYALMVIDHAAGIWSPGNLYVRVPGRLVFPAFCWLCVIALRKSRNVNGYLIGLGVLAVVSQLPFVLAVGFWGPNDIFALLSGCIGVLLLEGDNLRFLRWFAVIGIFSLCLFFGVKSIALGIFYCVLWDCFYEVLPSLSAGFGGVNKYVIYAIYPGHLLILGVFRLWI